MGPGGRGELGPVKLVGQVLAGFDVENFPLHPVGASAGDTVGEPFAVVAGLPVGEGDGSGVGEGVGIKKRGRGLGEGVTPIEDGVKTRDDA